VILDARFRSVKQFEKFVHQTLLSIEGIESYESSIVTRSVTEDGSVILSDDEIDLETPLVPAEE